jgi:hypothetical protein
LQKISMRHNVWKASYGQQKSVNGLIWKQTKNQTDIIIHFNVPGMQKYRLVTSFKCLIGLSF